MRRTWIISDTHFGHKKMVEKGWRPEGYEGLIIAHWASTIAPDDLVIHLGDVWCGKGPRVDVTQLPGQKVLLIGNHDHESDSWYMDHGFNFVCRGFEIRRYGYAWWFSHEPKAAGFMPWDINIHGHLHDDDHRKAEFASILTEDHHYLISLEQTDYKPLNFAAIASEVNNRK